MAHVSAIAADEGDMFPNFSNGKTCPLCYSETLHRSHRRGRDWWYNLIGLRPMRCSCCCERFYAPKHRIAQRREAV
ncbi:MAG: hypothetical protein M3Y50_00565 [Acidobacteriota bacterium]|nr:hypothetical protein [Acidobacteriota bacterium]